MMSSMRFRNSGRNVLRSASSRRVRVASLAEFLVCTEKPMGPTSRMLVEPTLEVITITVFLKLTVRPWPSVRRPSSRICSIELKTSGCAFSISSNSTTE